MTEEQHWHCARDITRAIATGIASALGDSNFQISLDGPEYKDANTDSLIVFDGRHTTVLPLGEAPLEYVDLTRFG